MKCSCGYDNRPDARFCKQCGKVLSAATEPAGAPRQVCPACGAEAKPGARYCPRCGRAMPAPAQAATQPSMPPLPTPSPSATGPGYAAPHTPPPPLSSIPSSPPKKGGKRWVWWVVGVLGFFCLIALIVLAIFAVPRIFEAMGWELPIPTDTPTEAPTETPTSMPSPMPTATPTAQPSPTVQPPSPPQVFGARVLIAAAPAAPQVGDTVVVTVTVVNTGTAPLRDLRYQLVGEWAPALNLTSDAVIEYGLIEPGMEYSVTFALEAIQAGEVTLWANVTMQALGRPEGLESEQRMTLVVQ